MGKEYQGLSETQVDHFQKQAEKVGRMMNQPRTTEGTLNQAWGVIVMREIQSIDRLLNWLFTIQNTVQFSVMKWDLDDDFRMEDWNFKNERIIESLKSGKAGRNLYTVEERIQCLKKFFLSSDCRPYTYNCRKSAEDRGGSAFIFKRDCSY